MKMLPVFALIAFAVPGLAHALKIEVVTKCGQKLPDVLVTEYSTGSLSVLRATIEGFKKAEEIDKRHSRKIELNEEGTQITAIGGVGEKRECVGDVVRAWGWLGSVDEGQGLKDLTVSPKEKSGLSPESTIRWTYSYVPLALPTEKTCETATKDEIEFADQCAVGSNDCASVAASAADCPAKAAH